MTIEFASLGSGSSGNATLIRAGDTMLLVDCGFSVAEAERRAACLGVSLTELAAVLVTHEHSDHIKGVAPLARKYGVPVYMTPGTHLSRTLPTFSDLRYIEDYDAFTVGCLDVQPVPVPHDAADPVQYVFASGDTRVGILTDLGSYTTRIIDAYGGCHGLLLEANHDLDLLACGPYPRFLRQRVGGAWGHLNNRQARAFVEQLDTSALQLLVLGHISQKNNSLSQVATDFAELATVLPIHYACQKKGFTWLTVAAHADGAAFAATF